MTIPLVVLAVLSVVGGLIGIPAVMGLPHWLHGFLSPVFEESNMRIVGHLSHATEWTLMAIAVAVMLAALFYARKVYVQNNTLPAPEGAELKPLHKLVYEKYRIDELYNAVITRPLNFISEGLHKVVDNQLVDGIVNGMGWAATGAGSLIRRAQTGNIGFYVFVMVISIAVILFVQLF
jgi:NADH-quinone oxidoreductase subunit L